MCSVKAVHLSNPCLNQLIPSNEQYSTNLTDTTFWMKLSMQQWWLLQGNIWVQQNFDYKALLLPTDIPPFQETSLWPHFYPFPFLQLVAVGEEGGGSFHPGNPDPYTEPDFPSIARRQQQPQCIEGGQQVHGDLLPYQLQLQPFPNISINRNDLLSGQSQ